MHVAADATACLPSGPLHCRAASDLRTRLEAASRARSTLDAALRGLQKNGRQEDVDAGARGAGGVQSLHLQEGQRIFPDAQRWERQVGFCLESLRRSRSALGGEGCGAMVPLGMVCAARE
jgi:hypothetical protein